MLKDKEVESMLVGVTCWTIDMSCCRQITGNHWCSYKGTVANCWQGVNIGCWLWDVDIDCCSWDSDSINCCWDDAGRAWCRRWASIVILTYLCCLWTAWGNEVGSTEAGNEYSGDEKTLITERWNMKRVCRSLDGVLLFSMWFRCVEHNVVETTSVCSITLLH